MATIPMTIGTQQVRISGNNFLVAARGVATGADNFTLSTATVKEQLPSGVVRLLVDGLAIATNDNAAGDNLRLVLYWQYMSYAWIAVHDATAGAGAKAVTTITPLGLAVNLDGEEYIALLLGSGFAAADVVYFTFWGTFETTPTEPNPPQPVDVKRILGWPRV